MYGGISFRKIRPEFLITHFLKGGTSLQFIKAKFLMQEAYDGSDASSIRTFAYSDLQGDSRRRALDTHSGIVPIVLYRCMAVRKYIWLHENFLDLRELSFIMMETWMEESSRQTGQFSDLIHKVQQNLTPQFKKAIN